MKKSIRGKTPQEAVSEKSGSRSGDSGFRGLLEGRFGADGPLGEELCSGGRKWAYTLNRRKVNKLIPAYTLSGTRCQDNGEIGGAVKKVPASGKLG